MMDSNTANANGDIEESSSASKWKDEFSSSDSEKEEEDEEDDDDEGDGDESSNDSDQCSWESFHSSSSNDGYSDESHDDDDSSDDDDEEESSDDETNDNRNVRLRQNNSRKVGKVENYFMFNSGIRFRRQQSNKNNNTNNNNNQKHKTYNDKNDYDDTTDSKRKRHNSNQQYNKNESKIVTKKTTLLLLLSILIWIYVQLFLEYHDIEFNYDSTMTSFSSSSSRNNPKQNNHGSFGIDSEIKTQGERRKSALQALGQAAIPFFKNKKKNKEFQEFSSHNRDNEQIDKLPKDCYAYSWQTYSFPNCNDVHEIDLRHALHMSKRGEVIPADLGEGDKSENSWVHDDKERARKMGYLGSGLWRQVWKVIPRIDGEDAVLKVMKSEHEMDQRNFDRHRRDSLVMERLTSSPNVVSIFGFCGNTVLTQNAGVTLDEYLFEDVQIVEKYNRNTSEGKVQLALEVMKGVQALHDIQDGPIIHADIQAKQFLFDPDDGRIRINDFNRCRFLPKNNRTGETCKLKIPSAPGSNRSPEEYELMHIDEKIDIYSTANILYGILTGHKPYDKNTMRSKIRKNVMNGVIPHIDEKFRVPGTIDSVLVEIIENAYSLEPMQRWSASTIIKKLESIQNKASLRRRQLK